MTTQTPDAVRTPLFERFGTDPFSWNLSEDGEEDGSGNPGANIVGGAIGVWLALNGGQQTVATIATAFNLSPAMIREAVEADYWLFLSPEEGAADDATFVESEGE
ncbi:MAG TPA: hypothetical protein H9899_11960 [Candidatus Sphingomonas excrementigallinarum]|nr:hypothetical protein [Candidatus Sphingomonas excrementigallinarum]